MNSRGRLQCDVTVIYTGCEFLFVKSAYVPSSALFVFRYIGGTIMPGLLQKCTVLLRLLCARPPSPAASGACSCTLDIPHGCPSNHPSWQWTLMRRASSWPLGRLLSLPLWTFGPVNLKLTTTLTRNSGWSSCCLLDLLDCFCWRNNKYIWVSFTRTRILFILCFWKM